MPFLPKGKKLSEYFIEFDKSGFDKDGVQLLKEVILSHDSEAKIYIVPDEVADNLDEYCWDFAADWIWNGPEKERFLKEFAEGKLGAMFGAPDFIDYLNRWVFPEQQSRLVKGLGCYDYEIPEEYKDYPKYNF